MSTSRVRSPIVKDAAGKSRRRATCITLRHSLWRLEHRSSYATVVRIFWPDVRSRVDRVTLTARRSHSRRPSPIFSRPYRSAARHRSGGLAGRGILLPDGAGDIRGDFIDVAHRVADFAYRIDRVARRRLDHADVLAYLGGRLGGLLGQGLDLVSDHREAATGLA